MPKYIQRVSKCPSVTACYACMGHPRHGERSLRTQPHAHSHTHTCTQPHSPLRVETPPSPPAPPPPSPSPPDAHAPTPAPTGSQGVLASSINAGCPDAAACASGRCCKQHRGLLLVDDPSPSINLTHACLQVRYNINTLLYRHRVLLKV